MNFTRKFNEFDEILLSKDARKRQPRRRDLIAVLIINFVTVAMSL
jgi:hypothetical protein